LFAQGVYQRDDSNGRVPVNPKNATQVVNLGATNYRAQPTGGGGVPWNGDVPSAGHVDYVPVSQVSLPPGQSAVLVIDSTPHEITTGLVTAGVNAQIDVSGATPDRRQIFFSNAGEGSTPSPSLGVTLGLAPARSGSIAITGANGHASWTHVFNLASSGSTVYVQAAERGHVTNVARTIMHWPGSVWAEIECGSRGRARMERSSSVGYRNQP
jgi:hypothetical protein